MTNQENGVVAVKQQQKSPKNLRRKLAMIGAGVGSSLYAMTANAALDISSLTPKITEQETNVETIGLAILGVLVLIAGISLLRRVIR